MTAGGSAVVAALEFDRVTFGYGRVPVVCDVSLRVDEGEFVAVVGPNGSGKTTLLQLGLGLLRPDGGRVRLFGVDAASFREWHRVGYVPQRAVARSTLPISVEEVVCTGLAAQQRLFRRQARHRERIEQVIDLFGLADVRRRRISELSGGQQQRTLLARALVTAPRLLVLDEPTTGVDAAARSVLRDSLERLVVEAGMAVVYVSHDPEGFGGLADRVIEMRGGTAVTLPRPALQRPQRRAGSV